MKKTIPAAIVLSLALMLTSCSATADKDPERLSGGQTRVAANGKGSTAENVASDGGFNIVYEGVRIALDDEADKVAKAIGKDYMYTENPSCAYVGIDFTYDYKSFIIYAQEKDGKVVVNTVEIRDDTVDCGGIRLGQTIDDVKRLYGEPDSTEQFGIKYIRNGTELQFITDGTAKVIFILYTHVTAD